MSAGTDILVVGSGASAVNAAYPLVQAGRSVVMLDVGFEDTVYHKLIPPAPYAEVRRTDPRQHRYLLGDNFEGVPLGKIGAGPQVTPPRRHVLANTETLLPTVSTDFAAMNSLAIGGLAGAWGAVSFPYLDSELVKSGLDPQELRRHYEIVSKRIGVCGGRNDDLTALRGQLDELQLPLEPDGNAELIYSCYQRERSTLSRERVYLGSPFMAVLTQPRNGRSPNPYHDMDFWTNEGGSVYRPQLGVPELQKYPNFSYRRPYLVERFEEKGPGEVSIYAKSLTGHQGEVFQARRLILAAGAMNTARLVLRSFRQYNQPLPMTCNETTYIPCLHYAHLGRKPKDRCHSLAQLTMIYDPTGDQQHLVQAQLYSYRSMMLFRLLKDLPLPCRETLRILQAIAPSLVIVVLQHEDSPNAGQTCVLRPSTDGTGDMLEIAWRPPPETVRHQRKCEKVMMRALRQLRCWPAKTLSPGHGTSAHYASQLPMTQEDKPLTTEPSGRLRGTTAVYVADGAALAYMPAKGLTFTLMANANRVGSIVLRGLAG